MNKPLVSCTVEEFLDLAVEKFARLITGLDDAVAPPKRLVYGLAGLSQLLGCSQSTAARIKKSGILAPAIHQTGKIIVIDADLALDLIKMKRNRRRD